MTATQLYQLFIAGKNLPTLTRQQARALLDICRSKLLALGKKLRPAIDDTTSELKKQLLDAHHQLVGGEQVYNVAPPQAQRTIEEIEQCLEMLRSHNKSTKPKTMPKTTPAATVQPAPRPAVNSNASLAAAILDEQDRRDAAALLKTRAEFSKLTPREASAFCRNGGKITA